MKLFIHSPNPRPRQSRALAVIWGALAVALTALVAALCVQILSEGSGAGSVHTDIAALTPNSEHLNGIAIRGSASANSTDTINAWLTEIGIIE